MEELAGLKVSAPGHEETYVLLNPGFISNKEEEEEVNQSGGAAAGSARRRPAWPPSPPPSSRSSSATNPHDKTKSTNLKLEIYLDRPPQN